MSSFSTYDCESSEASWWEIQHTYLDDGRGWASTDLAQFGDASVELLRAAVKDDLFEGFVASHRFKTEKEAALYLIEFARAAVCHKSMSFRVARVVASIQVQEVLRVTPPRICGVFGNYGGRDHGNHADRYCQKRPDHNGDHGPTRKAPATGR